MVNLVAEKDYWRVPAVISMPWGSDAQLVRRRNGLLLIRKESLLITSVNVVEDDESLTKIGETSSVFAGGWQIADYGNYFLLTNGVRTLLYSDLDVEEDPSLTTVRTFGAIADFDARLIYGNWTGHTNWVGWSMIAGEDIPAILASSSLSIKQKAKKQAGIAPMPFPGEILAIKRIGAADFVVYGDQGIAALRPTGGGYGVHEILGLPTGVGISTRSAVDGTLDLHVFLGPEQELWTIQPDLTATRIGFKSRILSPVTVVHDPSVDQFWISSTYDDKPYSYVLNKYGLSGYMTQTPTSLAYLNQALVGTGFTFDDVEAIPIELVSGLLDMKSNGQKRVTVVNISSNNIDSLTAQLLFGYNTELSPDMAEMARSGPVVRCSPDGAAFLNIAMNLGVLRVRGVSTSAFSRLVRIEVRYQNHDKRFVRGTRGFIPENNT